MKSICLGLRAKGPGARRRGSASKGSPRLRRFRRTPWVRRAGRCGGAVAVALAAFPAAAETLELSDGTVLPRVTVVAEDAVDLTVTHPLLGTLSLLKSDVIDRRADAVVANEVKRAAADPASAPAPATAADSEDNADPEVTSAPSREPSTAHSTDTPPDFDGSDNTLPTWLRGFDSSFSLGFSGTTGNDSQESVNMSAKTSRKIDYFETSLSGKYFFGRAESEVTRNEVTVDFTQRWTRPDSDWFRFVTARYEFDQFQSYRHRVSLFGGVGYKLIDEETFELSGKAGLGGTYEFGTVDDFTPEAVFGATAATWNISKTQSLNASVSYFPDLEELGEYRLTAGADWKIKLHFYSNLALKFGIENEYDSNPEPGDDDDDFKYFGALVVDF